MYFYHAHAIALGGRIGSTPLKVEQGSCALAVTGGASSASATKADPSFPDITFKSAKSEVSSEETTLPNGWDQYVTKASVVLEGLNIKNVVKASKITANITCTYTARDYEASIVSTGSIEDLEVKETAVPVQISNEMSTLYTTYGSVQVAMQNRYSQPFNNCLVGHGLTSAMATTDDLKAAYKAYTEQAALLNPKSAVVCSLVKGVSNLPVGATGCGGSIIKIAGFGNLYLGEVIVWPWMRCLNMFRIELVGADGKPSGSISGASVGGNGTGFPPGAGPLNGNGWWP